MPKPKPTTAKQMATSVRKKLLGDYPKEKFTVVTEGKKIIVGVHRSTTGSANENLASRENRAAIARLIARYYKGKVKGEGKTEVGFNGFEIQVKPESSTGRKTNEKSVPVYYGVLGKLNLKNIDVSAFRSIDVNFSSSKVLPRTLKEPSDIKGVSDFNKALEDASDGNPEGMTLKIKSKSGFFKIENAVGVVAVVGKEPKTDYVVVSKMGNKLHPSFFISYKMGTDATAFQNYSGLSEKTSPYIWNHKETERFFRDLQVLSKKSGEKEKNYKEEINDATIMKHSLYGMNFGKEFGLDNVNIIAQGQLKISSTGELTYDHIMPNGYIPPKRSPYHPVFGARRTVRNSRTPFGTVVKGYRVGIYPRIYRREWMLS